MLARASAEITTRVAKSGLPYENAQALYQLAMAWSAAGDTTRRDDYLTRSRKIAKARGFFELLQKTDSVLVAKVGESPPASATLTQSSRNVVASLSDVDVGEAADLLSLTRQA